MNVQLLDALRQHEDRETQVRLILLIMILCINLLVYLLLNIYFLLSGIPAPISSVLVHGLLLTAALVFVGLTALLLRTGRVYVVSILMHAVNCVMVPVAVLLSGGWEQSIITPFIVVVPVLAFALSGKQAGVRFSFVSILILFGLYYLDTAGWVFVDQPLLPVEPAAQLVGFLFVGVLVVVCLVGYEMVSQALHEVLSIERNQYERLASQDALTGLPNRTQLYDAVRRALRQESGVISPFALLYIDLNDFKPVNDRWGHAVGDKVLQVLAGRLLADKRKGHMVARIGGDEFAVLMRNIDSAEEVENLARVYIQSISMPFSIDGIAIEVTCSVGAVMCPAHGNTVGALARIGDSAMYHAKFSGAIYFMPPPGDFHFDATQTRARRA